MANQKHIEILRRGVDAWNQWRNDNPHITPDLSSPITHRIIFGLSEGIDPEAVDFSNSDLVGANFSDANLKNICFKDADLNSADFTNADLFVADLRKARLKKAMFWNANLVGANLAGAYLWGANFFRAWAEGADLSETTLVQAELRRADFTKAKLDGADLSYSYMGHTILEGNDLTSSKGLDLVFHFDGPSIIGVNTIFRSKGTSKSFWQRVGVPEELITFATSLSTETHFYSCFISHSSKDKEFVEKLYSDLQTEGVRCWLAPQDLRVGDRFREAIYESIRLHDKLLLILSENSISSPWVEDEVEAAMERERNENKLVLFPIQIDNAVNESTRGWAQSLRRMRNICDLRGWKDAASYRHGFERLIRDLKSK